MKVTNTWQYYIDDITYLEYYWIIRHPLFWTYLLFFTYYTIGYKMTVYTPTGIAQFNRIADEPLVNQECTISCQNGWHLIYLSSSWSIVISQTKALFNKLIQNSYSTTLFSSQTVEWMALVSYKHCPAYEFLISTTTPGQEMVCKAHRTTHQFQQICPLKSILTKLLILTILWITLKYLLSVCQLSYHNTSQNIIYTQYSISSCQNFPSKPGVLWCSFFIFNRLCLVALTLLK